MSYMNYSRIGVGVAMLVLSTHLLVAQQHGQAGQGNQQGMMGDSAMAQQHMQMHMRTMDSLDAHLDTLVKRMNTASGNAKVAAMADVINGLVAERRMMREHMRQMMGSRPGMMGNKGKQAPRGKRQPAVMPDSGAVDSGHAGHHPPK